MFFISTPVIIWKDSYKEGMCMIQFIRDFLEYFENIKKVLISIHFDLIFGIFVNLVVLSVLFKLTDIFENKLKNRVLKNKNEQMVKFIPILSRIIKSIVFFIMLAAFLQNHGYSVSSLIAGFGITGLAVGFAANSTISNVFGTIAIFSDKSYKLGDYIQVAGVEGTVEDINMRSTKIRTLDNALTIIPNAKIANGEIVNISRIHKRRFYETFGITYDTSDEKIKRAINIIQEVLEKNEDVQKNFIVYLDKLADSSININANAYCNTHDINKFRKIKETIILEIVRRFRQEGIEFAFPSQSIYMVNNEN